MARYTGSRQSITPSLTNDNYTLVTGVAESGRVLEVSWGGEVTTSTLMNTRIARSSGQAGAETAGAVAKTHPNSATNLISFVTTFATTQPTLDSGSLFQTSWNAHGGVVRWLAAPGEEFVLLPSAGISCRNGTGTALSSYHIIWEED